MLASTFFDLVLGIDIHFEMVPMPAPTPTPLPNPFVGMVFDPLGLLVGQAIGAVASLVSGAPLQGPVLINSMPATTVGTIAINALGVPHIMIPPGTAWTPMPKPPKPTFKGKPPMPGPPVAPEGDAISVFGSETVSLMGLSAVRLGDLSMSCGEPVRLPSSAVIAIPKGRPVMIGGPPALSLLAAVGGMVRSKWFAGHLHDLLSRMKPGRLRNFFNKAVCFLTGHPVDVASGRVLTGHVDWELPGPMPLKFERHYSSAWATRAGPLGHGWSHSFDQAVWVERGRVVYLDGEGRELELDTFDFPDHVLPEGASLFDARTRLTLRSLGGGRYEITNSDGIRHSFAPVAGARGARARWSRLTRMAARDGRAVAFEYDARGNLAWVHDSAGRAIAFEHDPDGRLIAVKLPHPTEDGWQTHTRYVHDDAGDLVRVIDPLRNEWRFRYGQHLLVQETNRTGLSFYFAYDGHGEDAYCVRTWGDGGIYDHVIDYDKAGKLTCVTNSLGQTTAYHMNAVGCVVKVVDPVGAVTAFEYDDRTLWRRKRIDPDGSQTSWDYDARGNAIRMLAPDGGEVRVEVDEHDQPVRATDAIGGAWRWSYDDAGRVVGRADPLDRRVQFRWATATATAAAAAPAGRDRGVGAGPRRLVGLTDAAGHETAVSYDHDGNVVAIRTPNAGENRWRYDRLGRCTVAIDAGGNEQRREHDGLGRVVRIADAGGRVRELEYDAEGHVVCERDGQREVRYVHAGMGRVLSRTEDGRTIGFAYDTEERLIAIGNEHREAHRLVRGPTGEIVAETGFDGVLRRYRRDAMGRVTEVACAGHRTTRYAYDGAGRVIAVDHSDGSAERYSYRLDGALVEASNDAATVAFERDALGRLLREAVTTAAGSPSWVSSAHDSLGRRVRVRSSHGLDEQIERDAAGRAVGVLARVASLDGAPDATPGGGGGSGWRADVGRESLGLETERKLPGGVVASWRRDSLGRPLAREVHSPAASAHATTYTWEAHDRLRTIADAAHGATQLQHDRTGNLTAATYEDGRVDPRAPDAVGNLFRAPDRSDRRYAAGGRILEARDRAGGLSTYAYDPEGNRAERVTVGAGGEPGGKWTYRWNGAGLLREAVRPDGEAVSFTYDALARRVSKTFRGRTTRFAWDGDVPLHEWVEGAAAPASAPAPTTATATATTWLFEPETFTPMARGDAGGWKSIVTDHVGAPSALYDEAGAQVWSATLDVYGDVRRLEGRREDCPFRWPGQYEDAETGLYYNRFRAYDPDVGQYLSPDPLRTWRCFETYLYVEDPLASIDPLGLAPEPVTHMIRVQIQRGTANLASVAVERTRAVTAVEVERAMLQAIQQLPSGERDLIPAAHGTAAQLSKKLRGIVDAGGVSDGGNILRGWLRGADRVRFDIENRGTNLLSCE